MKPEPDFSRSGFDYDQPQDEGPQPDAWGAVVEGLVVLAVIIACAVAVTLSGCGGSTAEDETKSTQPVVCPSDGSTCA